MKKVKRLKTVVFVAVFGALVFAQEAFATELMETSDTACTVNTLKNGYGNFIKMDLPEKMTAPFKGQFQIPGSRIVSSCRARPITVNGYYVRIHFMDTLIAGLVELDIIDSLGNTGMN